MSSPPVVPVRTYDAPAKINLHLSITGTRTDGYHEIVSVAACLTFGDSLRVTLSGDSTDRLACDDPALGTGAENLVVRALALFRERAPLPALSLELRKRIPQGAGLGGGSSDAAAALRAAQAFSERPLPGPELRAIAAAVGSDCPLFLHCGPVVVRGRGERVDALPERADRHLRGRRVFVAAPGIPIGTAGAYASVAAEGRYDDRRAAEAALTAWISNPEGGLQAFCYNRFQATIERKYRHYGAIAAELERAGWGRPILSGSGSAFYVLPHRPEDRFSDFERIVTTCFGPDVFRIDTTLL